MMCVNWCQNSYLTFICALFLVACHTVALDVLINLWMHSIRSFYPILLSSTTWFDCTSFPILRSFFQNYIADSLSTIQLFILESWVPLSLILTPLLLKLMVLLLMTVDIGFLKLYLSLSFPHQFHFHLATISRHF